MNQCCLDVCLEEILWSRFDYFFYHNETSSLVWISYFLTRCVTFGWILKPVYNQPIHRSPTLRNAIKHALWVHSQYIYI
jgi:hypothetical protein